ncbi:MAG: imidazole glycerol phosphate synthase subunit HisH [Methylomonas sp.]|nr:imidazole glycerol phosphate synthase subunit HisH [Methylomonas sp.]PPD22880.1 MAG: imidazole glycerol phosphate synthase subunit HisH [Methylomonas sp.]PPD27399.1 MAG: imidazole glycerol phosphate synthase subunit HisH [Methylomonas sp.]PPD39375.1 MAG: imidazole glycerol phosphate synthase subunit HisH [Methylomonas sp.]PPD41857.1 MAG: imidazole glycerol phosphate synthase subunit HisH [Methylomonas sp.]
MTTVAVIDYGMGNLHSIAKALQHAEPNAHIQVSAQPGIIDSADRVVFPGVGAMGDCMKALHELNLVDTVRSAAATKPFLGICLGMQALLTDSEENGYTDCLHILPGHVRRFDYGLRDADGQPLKIPHMGWNRVHQRPHPLWHGIAQDSRFYFVHSYYAVPDDAGDSAATSDYPDAFTCALARNNLFAVQFHPEKSQAVGLQLLTNFLRWDGAT